MPKQNEKKQFINSIITIIVLIIALIILFVLYIKTSANPEILTFEELAKTYCNQKDAESVSICNNQVIEVRSSSLGGGSTYYHRDGTSFTCPVIAPENMSPNCKSIFNAELAGQWNCVAVC